MPKTAQPQMIEAQKGVRGRVYQWMFNGGYGFATADPELPAEGRRPRTNFYLHGRNFLSKTDLKVISERGDVVEFDLEEQEFIRGRALDATRIRLVL